VGWAHETAVFLFFLWFALCWRIRVGFAAPVRLGDGLPCLGSFGEQAVPLGCDAAVGGQVEPRRRRTAATGLLEMAWACLSQPGWPPPGSYSEAMRSTARRSGSSRGY
jgi:hypothetical protein